MKPNNNLPALRKGKEISNPELVQHYSAPQYDIKDKVPWSPPPPNWIKLNVDAGFDPLSGHAGLGFIARNHMGKVLLSGWSSDQLCKRNV
jgi:hypothetical protein